MAALKYDNGDVLRDGALFGQIESTSEGYHFRSEDFGDTSKSFATEPELKTFLESFEE